jgi:hypothetical protein
MTRALTALLAVALFFAYLDERRWMEFRDTHGCVVAEEVGHPGPQPPPGKTGYRCDTGMVYR